MLKLKERVGKGGAIIKGIKKAHGEYICFVDADESFYPRDIKKMFSFLKNYDCVIASKWVSGSSTTKNEPLIRRIASRLFNLFVRFFFGLDFKTKRI